MNMYKINRDTMNPTKFAYDQTPLQKQIVVQNQIIKQMSDPRNKEFYDTKDLIAAQEELKRLIELNNAEQIRLNKPPSFPLDGGSKSKRHRRKSKSHRKHHRKSHKKSRKH
jgi:hypothetical protein